MNSRRNPIGLAYRHPRNQKRRASDARVEGGATQLERCPCRGWGNAIRQTNLSLAVVPSSNAAWLGSALEASKRRTTSPRPSCEAVIKAVSPLSKWPVSRATHTQARASRHYCFAVERVGEHKTACTMRKQICVPHPQRHKGKYTPTSLSLSPSPSPSLLYRETTHLG